MANIASDSICVGTRQIELRQKTSDASVSAAKGLVAVLEHQEADSSPSLLVLATDGANTFQGRIGPEHATKIRPEHLSTEETKEELSSSEKLKVLCTFILKDTSERISVTYEQVIDELPPPKVTGIKVVIREKLSTGIVKVLWTDTLKQANDSSGTLSFCSTLGSCVNESKVEIEALRKERDDMQANLWGWKDTAEKLDRDWQSEKDALTHRFFELYQKTHQELVKSRQEVTRLEKQLEQAKAASSSAASAKKKHRPVLPPIDAGIPDDTDFKQFDSDLVDRLAAGQPVYGSLSRPPPTAPVVRTNPLTGEKLVTGADADALLENPESVFQAEHMSAKRQSSGATSTAGKRTKHASL